MEHIRRMNKRINKKGFYFTLDALFSSFLLVGGLLLISQYLVKEPTTESIDFISADVLSALSELKMSEVNATFVSTYLSSSSHTNPKYTVLEQIGAYWATNEPTLAINLTEYLLKNLFPNNTGVNLVVEADTIFNKTHDRLPANLLTGERMITGIMAGGPLTGATSSAYLRRISDKSTSSFAYFGGFVGQGKITVRLDNLPSDITTSSNVREIFLEGEFDSDFNLLINGANCRFVNVNNAEVQRFNVTNCSSLLQPGNNTVTLNFTESITNASISGGLLGVRYVTNEFGTAEASGMRRTYLPDIDGVINLYDGFMVPGNLISMNVYLHYWAADNVTLPIFMDIGNTEIYHSNSTGEITKSILDVSLNDPILALNYTAISNTTVPIRLGFFSGNMSNSTGNVSDIILLTSQHGSMKTEDIAVTSSTYISRIAQVKIVDNMSIGIILNASGNRVGLTSFGTGASVKLDSPLSTVAATLYGEVDKYKSVSSPTANRDLCSAMEVAKIELEGKCVSNDRKCAVILMTDGDLLRTDEKKTKTCSVGDTYDREVVWRDAVNEACNFSNKSGINGNQYNITFYTIAFGPEAANDPAIIGNLSLMANCTGGKFRLGNNASEIADIYREFATELAASSIVYTFQRATSATSVESRLYGDSYIDISYEPPTPAIQQSQIPITFQTEHFGTCTPTVNIPEGVTVIDAHIVSYSGDYWTKRLTVDGTVVYNLSIYGSNYLNLGDPFQVLMPPHLLTAGNHLFSIALGANSSHTASCSISANDSLIYTGLVSAATNRTIVLPSHDGCLWLVESEDVEFQSLAVPAGYTGAKQCNYTNASISYDSEDAYDVATVNLLMQLDPDKDGRVSVNFQEEDLEISVTLVTDVPYLWGPTLVKVNAWQ